MDDKKEALLSSHINQLLSRGRTLVAIDGRCGAGKTTLGKTIKEKYGCTLLHMDDFFLRPAQRSSRRLSTPGENIDHERFLEEVLKPARRGVSFSYRPFDCSNMCLGQPIEIDPSPLVVIEGAYSCHPQLSGYYDLRVFLSVGKEEQLLRISERNGPEIAELFKKRWIPLEEAYFSFYHIPERCNLVFG